MNRKGVWSTAVIKGIIMYNSVKFTKIEGCDLLLVTVQQICVSYLDFEDFLICY